MKPQSEEKIDMNDREEIHPEDRALEGVEDVGGVEQFTAQRSWWRVAIQVGLVIAVVGGSVAVAAGWIATKPSARKRNGPPKSGARVALLVETEAVSKKTKTIPLESDGTVMPARVVALRPEVSGKLVEVSAKVVPGGILQRGEHVAKVDDRGYKLSVAQARGDLVKARAEAELERGSQDIAKREYETLGVEITESNRDLVLRKPQLQSVRASVQQATANLGMARLNVERTEVVSPLHAVVRSRAAEVGSQVSAQTTIAELVGVESWWVEVSVPVAYVRWMKIPETLDAQGSRARITYPTAWGEDVARDGRVIRLLADLEENGRMARLLVEVQDPMSLREENAGKPKLLLGSWVHVELEGEGPEDLIVLKRSLVHDGDQVWVWNEGTLDIRTVDVAFRGREEVLIRKGLRMGDQIVTTQLTAPVQGMKLRVKEEKPPSAPVADTQPTELKKGGARE